MQSSLEFPVRFSKDAYVYGDRSDGGTHGIVLTKPHVVELILDLAGYTTDKDLSGLRLLEPSCGLGAFLLPAAQRLLASARKHGRDVAGLGRALLGFDIDDAHVAQTRAEIIDVLEEQGVDSVVARQLAEQWVLAADFLLEPLTNDFDVVVGNPPYIRIEQLSPELQTEYRRRFSTIFDRADLYVAFIERSLHLLAPHGVLSFVCADRWTLNRYGTPLRELVTSGFELRTYIDLHRASPFEADVIAYPSIFVIGREKLRRPTRVLSMCEASPAECGAIRQQLSDGLPQGGLQASEYPVWFTGGEPWVLSSPAHLSILRQLEERLPLLENSGGITTVRIGVASGNDSIYIVPSDLDIEADRLVPLVMRDDIEAGAVKDGRRCVINTFETKGTIDLEKYPRLEKYFSQHSSVIKRRHVARKNKDGWFRTIDRVYPELASRPKLLIPDIAGANEVVFESGNYYPHHNLYFIISDVWDLEVLGGLLSSRVALFFVWSYAVKMRGGYLRFQAQYLRRIRVPRPESLSVDLQRQIKAAFRERDFAVVDALARDAYQLSEIPTFDFVDTRK